jgi:chemotaxis protein CheZ
LEHPILVDRDIETDEADTPEDDRLINNELSELRKYVEMIASAMRDMEVPATRTSDQLTQATAHLHDLGKMTEESTHRVLALTEAIETNRGAIQAALEHLEETFGVEHAADVESLLRLVKADERRFMDLHVALSFQGLVAERVAKLVTILNEVQNKLLKLVVISGSRQKKDGTPTKDGRRGNEMLRQLETSQPTTPGKSLADDIY